MGVRDSVLHLLAHTPDAVADAVANAVAGVLWRPQYRTVWALPVAADGIPCARPLRAISDGNKVPELE